MLRLGCVSYLNALPFTHYLDRQNTDLILRPPAELLSWLLSGKVDAALLPAVDFFEHPHLLLLPDMAIAAASAVQTVKLFIQDPQFNCSNLQSIYLDIESKTSQRLLKVLLHHRFERDLSSIQFLYDPQLKNEAQAFLWIGDKAFQQAHLKSFDLGKLWNDWTGLPFVFAIWMSQNPEGLGLYSLLHKALHQGLEQIEEIIQSVSTPEISKDSLREYFTKTLHYSMGGSELRALQTFFQLLKPIEGYHHELDFRFISKD